MTDWIKIAVLALSCLNMGLLIAAIVLITRPRDKRTRKDIVRAMQLVRQDLEDGNTAVRRELSESQAELRQEVTKSVADLGGVLGEQQRTAAAQQEQRFRSFEQTNARDLEFIRTTMERRVAAMQEDNNRRLDEMRGVVEEKLQKTLSERVDRSFKTVSEQLEQVYRGLGEMQSLAAGVGDLKKVLSNVKTRGILGEIQLGAIFREILSPEQYLENAATKHDSGDRVEFAVKLPAENNETVLLPVDAKFPGDLYTALQEAYESGAPEAVEHAAEAFKARLRQEAKDVHTKYIDPPYTTEFAVLFLPFEGLYAEAVNRGMVEELQTQYRVSIAGPSTMAAFLNTLQMGFRSVALQKRSGEVWQVLGAVRTEFENFQGVLASSQKHLSQASEDLDKLAGTRTRRIMKALNGVERLDPEAAEKLLDDEAN